jgi:hypothetical protein
LGDEATGVALKQLWQGININHSNLLQHINYLLLKKFSAVSIKVKQQFSDKSSQLKVHAHAGDQSQLLIIGWIIDYTLEFVNSDII